MMKQTFSKFITLFLKYFAQGLLYTAPIFITAYILYLVFEFADNLIPLDIPGVGIVIVITFTTIIGYLGSSFVGQPILNYFLNLIKRTPLIKDIYTAIKDLMSAFVGKKRKFTEPVLVKMTDNGLEKLGFITQHDLQELGIKSGKVAVYLPFSYGIMGSLFIAPMDLITPLDMNSATAMKFIMSGGIIEPPENTDDENEQTKNDSNA